MSQVQDDDMDDPEPLMVISELITLICQPGSLGLIASVAAAAIAGAQLKQATDKDRSEIRRKLYEIDRALVDGFASLSNVASLIDQFNFVGQPLSLGAAPIAGFKNAQKLRKAHEDCRDAVREARDAFMALSSLLRPSEQLFMAARRLLDQLNETLATLRFGAISYAHAMVVLAAGLTAIDRFICQLGEEYQFRTEPRNYETDFISRFRRFAG